MYFVLIVEVLQLRHSATMNYALRINFRSLITILTRKDCEHTLSSFFSLKIKSSNEWLIQGDKIAKKTRTAFFECNGNEQCTENTRN